MAQSKNPWSVEPDDPWCWLIAGGNCAVAVTVTGFFRCFGVFYKPLMAEFNLQYGDVSLMSGLFGGAMGLGALVPAIAQRFGCRMIGMFLGAIYSLSLLIASRSQRMELIHVFVGVMAGVCGGGLIYNMYLTCNRYFAKHRAKGTNIALIGVPIGVTLLAPLLDYLISQYTWRGALMIMSAVTLHCCVAAALYRPLVLKPETSTLPAEDKERTRHISQCSEENSSLSRKRRETFQRWYRALDCALFGKPVFVLMLISAIGFYSGVVGAVFVVVPFGIEELGLTSMQASFLLTLCGAGDCLGKLFYGTIGDFKSVDRALLLSITTFLCAVSYLSITACVTFEAAATITFMQGFMASAYHGLNAVLYADIVGLERLPVALGYHGLLNNVASFPFIYLLGFSIDKTGDVRVPFYISAGLLICTSASLLGVFLLRRREQRRHDSDIVAA